MKALAVALCLSLGTLGCATGLDRAKQTITVAEKTWALGRDTLVSADEQVKAQLQAKFDAGQITAADAQAQFHAWVGKRAKVLLALDELQHAVAFAGLGIAAVEAGQAKSYGDALADVVKALAEATSALAEIGVKLPWSQ